MTPPCLQKLKAAGLWSLCISLDHPSAAEHDRLRGAPGAHAQACRTLRLAREHGFYTMAATVATRALVEEKLLAPMHRLAGDCGAHEWRIIEPMPCGLLARDHADTLLTPDHIADTPPVPHRFQSPGTPAQGLRVQPHRKPRVVRLRRRHPAPVH